MPAAAATCGFLAGAVIFVFFHELGHGPVDLFALPVVGPEVAGTLRVRYDRLSEMAARTGGSEPLAGVRVKISARSRVLGVRGRWNGWEETRTGADGRFAIGKRKGCGDRRFKVEVKFEDETLEIRHERATSSVTKVRWYEAVQDADAGRVRSRSGVALGTLTFRTGGPGNRFCDDPGPGFRDLLRVFEPAADAGFPEHLDRGETTLDGFLTRADAADRTPSPVDRRPKPAALAGAAGGDYPPRRRRPA